MNFLRNQTQFIFIFIIIFSVSTFSIAYTEPIKISGERKIFGLGNLLATDISEDGKTLLSLGEDAIYLWDVNTERVIRKINKEPERFCSMDLSPDAKTVITSNWDGIANIRNIESGEILRSFTTKEIVVFSRDGSRVALASVSREIEIHSVTSGEKIYTLPGSSAPVYFAPDGKSLVTGYVRGIAVQWDLQTGKSIKIFEEPAEGILWKDDFESGSLDLSIWKSSPDGSFSVKPLPHPGGEYSLVSETIHNGTAAIELTLDNPETCVAFRYQLIGSSKESKIEFRTDDKTHKLFFDDDRMCNSTVIVPFNDLKKDIKKRIYRWEISNIDSSNDRSNGVRLVIDTIRLSSEIPDRDVDANCFSITAHGKKLVVGGLDCYAGRTTWDPCSGQARVWNYQTGEYLKKYNSGHCVHNIAIEPSGKMMLIYPDLYGTYQPVQQIDLESGKVIQSVSEHISVPSPLYFDNASKILMGTIGSDIKIYDAADFSELKRFEGHTGLINDFVASKDGDKILMNCSDRVFRLWDINSDSVKTFQYKGITWDVSMNLSPDGSKAIFYGYNAQSNLFTIDFDAGSKMHKFDKNSGQNPKFSPDGKWIYTIKDEKSFLIWDATNNKFIRKFPKAFGFHEYTISPDSSMILLQGFEDKILLCETTNGGVLHTFPGSFSHGKKTFSFSSSGKECMTLFSNTISFWDTATGKANASFPMPAEWEGIMYIDYGFKPDQFIAGATNKKIYIVNRNSFSVLYQLSRNFYNVRNLVFSKNGTLLTALGLYPEHSFCTWNIDTGNQ